VAHQDSGDRGWVLMSCGCMTVVAWHRNHVARPFSMPDKRSPGPFPRPGGVRATAAAPCLPAGRQAARLGQPHTTAAGLRLACTLLAAGGLCGPAVADCPLCLWGCSKRQRGQSVPVRDWLLCRRMGLSVNRRAYPCREWAEVSFLPLCQTLRGRKETLGEGLGLGEQRMEQLHVA